MTLWYGPHVGMERRVMVWRDEPAAYWPRLEVLEREMMDACRRTWGFNPDGRALRCDKESGHSGDCHLVALEDQRCDWVRGTGPFESCSLAFGHAGEHRWGSLADGKGA